MQSSLRHTYKHCPQSIKIAATFVIYFKTMESSSSFLVLKDIRIIKLNSADTQVLRATQPIEDGSDCLDMCLQGRMAGEHVEMCVSIQFHVQGSGTLDSISVNFYFGQDRIVLYLIRSMVYNSIIKHILLLHQISILYCW